MSKFTVVVTDDRFGAYREERKVLGEIGAELEVMNLSTEQEAIAALSHADGILLNLFPLTAGIITSLVRCKVISRYGVGYDNVDVETATRKGIWVCRVPDYCHEEVSDQTLALLFGCVRKVAYKDRKIREGKWNLHKDLPTFRLAGKVLGIVGFGGVGNSLNRKAASLGFSEILVYDPLVDPSLIEKAGARPVPLALLLERSDYISLHVPLNADTSGMIGEREIAGMKQTAILVNTSRGPVIDQDALCAALREGRIGGAGLDVFKKEPIPADSPLLTLDTVVLSDHAGWYSEESVIELKTKAARNVAAVLSGGKPPYPVNSL